MVDDTGAYIASDAPSQSPAATIGKEFLAALAGECTIEQAANQVKQASRHYAKRQLTWLRRNEAIHWIRWEKVPDFQSALQNATEFLAALGLG